MDVAITVIFHTLLGQGIWLKGILELQVEMRRLVSIDSFAAIQIITIKLTLFRYHTTPFLGARTGLDLR